jgi:hypothetical protein
LSTFHSSLTYYFTIDFLIYFILKWHFTFHTIPVFRTPSLHDILTRLLLILFLFKEFRNYKSCINTLCSLTTTNRIMFICYFKVTQMSLHFVASDLASFCYQLGISWSTLPQMNSVISLYKKSVYPSKTLIISIVFKVS